MWLLPFCISTLATAILQLIETYVEILFWCNCEICCCFLLNIFCGHKIMAFRSNRDSWKEPRVAWSPIWRIWWLRDGWNLVLYQKRMLCERPMKRHVVQFPFVSSFWWPDGIPRLIQNFNIKSSLCDCWLHSYHSSMLLASHCTSHVVGIPYNFSVSCTVYTDILSASSHYTVLGILKLSLLRLQKNLMITLL